MTDQSDETLAALLTTSSADFEATNLEPNPDADVLRLELLPMMHADVHGRGEFPVFANGWIGPESIPGATVSEDLGVRIVDVRNGFTYVLEVETRDVEVIRTIATTRGKRTERSTRTDVSLITFWYRAAGVPLSSRRRRPEAQLSSIAAGFLADNREWIDKWRTLPSHLRVGHTLTETIELDAEDKSPAKTRPALELIAAQARIADSTGETLADHFAKRYFVSSATTERWIRAVRASESHRHLLPERLAAGNPGRPRKTTTKGTEDE